MSSRGQGQSQAAPRASCLRKRKLPCQSGGPELICFVPHAKHLVAVPLLPLERLVHGQAITRSRAVTRLSLSPIESSTAWGIGLGQDRGRNTKGRKIQTVAVEPEASA